jgi:serine/threonine protein kinase
MPSPREPEKNSPEEPEIEIDFGHDPRGAHAPAGTQTPPPYASGYDSGAFGSAAYESSPPLAGPRYDSNPPPSRAYASSPPPSSGAPFPPPPGASAAGAPAPTPARPQGGPPPPEALPPGTLIDGKYQILTKLGQGGMGAVYRARHVLLNKDVAIKVIAPHLAQDPTFKARFFREAKVAMEFVHRHAVPVRDFGLTRDGLYYMTMDYSTGKSLRSIVEQEGALEPRRAVGLVRQILEALAEAHRKKVVHRDLKPDNVMVEEQGGEEWVKVLDFGLAKMLSADEEASALATGGQILGTPAYMSPEQGCGEEVDHRADLYACGVVLYQLLSGRLPFTAPTSRQLIMKHVSAPPPPLFEANPEIELPPGLDDAVMKALAKEKKDRYQSAEEFSAALERFASGAMSEGKRPLVQIGGGAYAAQDTVTGETYIPEDISGSLTGHTIDRYKILAPIAEGGMGAVYQAEHLLMHRECAFKVIKGGRENDEEVLARFQREAQVSARFKHPSAVEVYDFGRMGKKMFFMAMELVRGKPLSARIEETGGLPLEDAVEIGVQLLEVLEAAHKAGIVHRDLKPDNVMLQEVDGWKNQVKLLDFGIARLKDAKGEAAKFHTVTGVFFGTPQYSSPEQCKGEPVDGRADVYSAGVILYEMLTGELPWQSETAQGFLVQHLVSPPRKMREVKPDLQIPADVEAVIMKALEKQPEKRFQTAHEFADALKRAAQIFPSFEVGEHGLKPAGERGLFGFGQFRELHVSTKFLIGVAIVGALIAAIVIFLTREAAEKPGRLVVKTEPGSVSVGLFSDEGESKNAETGPTGEYDFGELEAGHYRIIFMKGDFERIEQEITIRSGETLELPVRLKPK